MYLKYKIFAGNKKYTNEIGKFKYAWYSVDDYCLIIGIKKMEDIYLPITIEESNLFVEKLFNAFKSNNFVEITGLCFSEHDINGFSMYVDKNKQKINYEDAVDVNGEFINGCDVITDKEKLMEFVYNERRYAPEGYDVKVNS